MWCYEMSTLLALYITFILGVVLLYIGKRVRPARGIGVAFLGLSLIFLTATLYPEWSLDAVGYAMLFMGVGAMSMGIYGAVREILREGE